jgi:hypothetical protein
MRLICAVRGKRFEKSFDLFGNLTELAIGAPWRPLLMTKRTLMRAMMLGFPSCLTHAARITHATHVPMDYSESGYTNPLHQPSSVVSRARSSTPRRRRRVAGRILDITVPEVGLQRPGIDPIVRQLEAAGMPQHVGVYPDASAAAPARLTMRLKPSADSGAPPRR